MGIKVKKLNLTILAIIALIFSSHVYAADPNHIKKLWSHKGDCSYCDLSGYDMTGFWLSKYKFEDANLEGAILIEANLTNANLIGVNLESANLQGVNLVGADLSGANLKNANLSGANLKGATLCNTIMPDGSVIYSGC